MYIQGVPTYVYELPCGHDFRSLTRSEPDDEDGSHWFFCTRCRKYHGIPVPVERRPLNGKGRRLGDGELATRIDSALQCDRIAGYYRRVWDAQSIDQVRISLDGISRRLVKRVAADLGVYDNCA